MLSKHGYFLITILKYWKKKKTIIEKREIIGATQPTCGNFDPKSKGEEKKVVRV